jgi:hypothetical protein
MATRAIYPEFLTLRLTTDQLTKLKRVAEEKDLFVSDVLRSLIETALDGE